MRRLLIAGNWKMNHGPSQSREFGRDLKAKGLQDFSPEILLCPPYVSIQALRESLEGTPVQIGGQNLHQEPKGAYTGEISGEMLKESGCVYVLIGHSERRQYFYETDDMVHIKILRAHDAGLVSVVCIGETLEEREKGITKDVIMRQLKGALEGLSLEIMKTIVLAYEPVWAIGTGKTATAGQAQEVHALIRKILNESFGTIISENTRILYGGSAKPNNAEELLSEADIDGLLIGGASLKTEDFYTIIGIAHQLMNKG
ncbi:MAG: Triosephosphate isomerase [Marinimicrobia bacterium 46_43]|nr:MAG: Triosephosphate isomerase [Marinimicrobia bacterium 46_43]